MKKASSAAHIARQVGIPKSRGVEAVMKAQLITAVLREATRQQLTHAELAERSRFYAASVAFSRSQRLIKVSVDTPCRRA